MRLKLLGYMHAHACERKLEMRIVEASQRGLR